jgi:NAD(P)-dependent dehydrogenase (short-subunit alcohol dehydrogenase family)
MRDANAIIYLVPGVGMLSFAKDKSTARIAAEFYVNAINVMRGSSSVGRYVGLSEQEAFNIEYWLLEEAKLQRMPKPKSLAGRVAVVTGGAGGIGQAIAARLMGEGACVVLADIDAQSLDNAVADFGKLFGKDVVSGVHVDVTSEAKVEAAFHETVLAFGGLDILVANAGIAWPDTGGEDMPDEAWRKVIDIDLNGAYWCCREFGRAMLAHGRGAIVTVGSMSGLISNKPQRQVHYNAAKAGVHHMTRSLAGEWADRGVRVNCVAPTYVDTAMSRGALSDPQLYPVWMEMTPMKRVARADEIASAILFLSSDAASAITGSVLVVDCGYTIW